MRTAFMETLRRVAEEDPRVYLVVGDLGFGVVEPFARALPDQFLNVGVAEQNMTGVAAGLALCGKVVFTYSIANFPTLRCVEQIRNDVCYHGANVKVAAVGGGFAYGALGMTHHATEDLAILRALPGMTVVAPGDPRETEAAVRAAVAQDGPFYLRLGRAGEPSVHTRPIDFQIGRAIPVRDGSDVTLISTGGMLHTTVTAAATLADLGIEARVLSMHTLKPLDCDAVLRAAAETGAIVTVEEHSVLGGLGGAVAETLAEADGPRVPFRRLGLPSVFTREVGSQEYLRARCGLSPESVVETVATLVRRGRGERRSGGVPGDGAHRGELPRGQAAGHAAESA